MNVVFCKLQCLFGGLFTRFNRRASRLTGSRNSGLQHTHSGFASGALFATVSTTGLGSWTAAAIRASCSGRGGLSGPPRKWLTFWASRDLRHSRNGQFRHRVLTPQDKREVVKRQRLDEMSVEHPFVGCRDAGCTVVARQGHQLRLRALRAKTEQLCEFLTVHAWHRDINEGNVRAERFDNSKCVRSVRRPLDFMSFQFQQRAQRLSGVCAVIDKQDAFWLNRTRRSGGPGHHACADNGQPKRYLRPPTFTGAPDGDGPIVCRHQVLDHSQSDSESAFCMPARGG